MCLGASPGWAPRIAARAWRFTTATNGRVTSRLIRLAGSARCDSGRTSSSGGLPPNGPRVVVLGPERAVSDGSCGARLPDRPGYARFALVCADDRDTVRGLTRPIGISGTGGRHRFLPDRTAGGDGEGGHGRESPSGGRGPGAQGAARNKPAANTVSNTPRHDSLGRRSPDVCPAPLPKLTGPHRSHPSRFPIHRTVQRGAPNGSGSTTIMDSRSSRTTSTIPRSRSGSGARTCSGITDSSTGRIPGRTAPATEFRSPTAAFSRSPAAG